MPVQIKHKIILWDFDGVIMDSMPVRDLGFLEVLKAYPKEQVDKLMVYHRNNGGLSRYVKFRYFFNVIRSEAVTEAFIQELAGSFSEIMLSLLINPALLIQDCITFIQYNFRKYPMHIVSGSDGNELAQICKGLSIDHYFLSIMGSPTPKTTLVSNVIEQYGYSPDDLVLIGDSFNDYDASFANGVTFMGYNNHSLKKLQAEYIESFL